MEEPISTYYFKHGTSGLSGVHLIGIKEVPTQLSELPQKDLMAIGNNPAPRKRSRGRPKGSISISALERDEKIKTYWIEQKGTPSDKELARRFRIHESYARKLIAKWRRENK